MTEDFFDGFLECALWSSTNDDGEPLDDDFGVEDIAPESLKELRTDCVDFYNANERLLDIATRQIGRPDSYHGHDFWLTRCGHGAGFWDRGYKHGIGDKLTEAAKVYGNVDLYVGDDGKVYAS